MDMFGLTYFMTPDDWTYGVMNDKILFLFVCFEIKKSDIRPQ